MTQIIKTLLIIIGIGYLAFRIFDINPVKLVQNQVGTPSPTPDNWLPTSWTLVESNDNKLKLEKKVDAGLKPQIVFEKSVISENTDFTTYSNRLIAGAKSALPSLRYQKDSFQDDSRNLSGYYYNQKNKILITQRIFEKDSNIFTLTASYSDVNLESEINTIFDSIVSRRLPN